MGRTQRKGKHRASPRLDGEQIVEGVLAVYYHLVYQRHYCHPDIESLHNIPGILSLPLVMGVISPSISADSSTPEYS